MKRFGVSPLSVLIFLFFPYLFLFLKGRRKYAIIYMSVLLLFVSGCYLRFYNTNTRNTIDRKTINELKNQNKYFVAHLKDGVKALKNVDVSNNILEADLDSIPPEHYNFADKLPSTSYRYKKDSTAVLDEIHIYAPTQSLDRKTHVSLPLTAVTRVDIYKKDVGKTSTSAILSTIGFAALAALIVGLIAAAGSGSKTPPPPTTGGGSGGQSCDCPKLYTYNGAEYQFRSGLFSGAVYASAERADYYPLGNITDTKGKFSFRLVNDRQEKQFINQVQLIRIAHAPAETILIDRHGTVHNYTKPEQALSTSMMNDQVGESLAYRDGNSYVFNEKADPASSLASVILTFRRPANAGQAKLIVNAKNTMWAGLLYEQFSTLFGDKLQEFIAKRDKAGRSETEEWEKEQALPMVVSVETETGWKQVDYFPLTGNSAGRDMIMPINIADVKGQTLRVKIESAYMFWELDYAAMDFTPDHMYKPEYIRVAAAVNSSNPKSETADLRADDKHYDELFQNNYISFEFDKPKPIDNQADSYFLLSSGYYHSTKRYYGDPDWWTLMSLKKKWAFSAYSEEKYKEAAKLFTHDMPRVTAQIKR